MPESKVRGAAAAKQKQKAKQERDEQKAKKQRHVTAPGSRQWIAPAMITIGLIGVLWLVVYYITASVGITVPLMTALGGWNILIGMGCMAAAFALATFWK